MTPTPAEVRAAARILSAASERARVAKQITDMRRARELMQRAADYPPNLMVFF